MSEKKTEPAEIFRIVEDLTQIEAAKSARSLPMIAKLLAVFETHWASEKPDMTLKSWIMAKMVKRATLSNDQVSRLRHLLNNAYYHRKLLDLVTIKLRADQGRALPEEVFDQISYVDAQRLAKIAAGTQQRLALFKFFANTGFRGDWVTEAIQTACSAH